MKKMNIKIGCSPITNRIWVGNVLKNGLWSTTKYDVTDDAIGSVAQHLLKSNEKFIFTLNGKNYEMNVNEVLY
jgi:hypothetical protein